MSISQVSSPMLNHLDAVLSPDKNPLLTVTIGKVKKYLLNYEGWGQWMLSIAGYDTQTIAFQAIYDYAFRGLPDKRIPFNPTLYDRASNTTSDLETFITDFLEKMRAFHTGKNEPPSNYWKDKMANVEKICRLSKSWFD